MKTDAWLAAFMAHVRVHFDVGECATFSQGDVMKVMGCSRNTVKKHFKSAIEIGKISVHEAHIKGCIFERWYQVEVD